MAIGSVLVGGITLFNMESKLGYAEEGAELERDLSSCLDFNTPHHEPALSISKRNERAISEIAPPTQSTQAVRQVDLLVQHSGSEERVVEQP